MRSAAVSRAASRLPESDATHLAKAMGLLACHVSIYGPTHGVTGKTLQSAFESVSRLLPIHGEIDFVREKQILHLNGTPVDTTGSTGRLLMEHLTRQNVESFTLSGPPNAEELGRFMALLCGPPKALDGTGGLIEAVKRAGLHSVRLNSVAYQRMPDESAPALETRGPTQPKRAPTGNMFDLSADLEADADLGFVMPPSATRAATKAAAQPAWQPLEDAVRGLSSDPGVLREEVARLSGMLRQVASLLKTDASVSAEPSRAPIVEVLSKVRDGVEQLVRQSESRIDTLAGQVKADRAKVAELEDEARRRGVGLALTREELVTRFAEISQEVMQPLTVSSGVLEMLSAGKLGPVTQGQRDMLGMAVESMARVDQLMGYLKRITGEPATLQPDRSILDEAYGGQAGTRR